MVVENFTLFKNSHKHGRYWRKTTYTLRRKMLRNNGANRAAGYMVLNVIHTIELDFIDLKLLAEPL